MRLFPIYQKPMLQGTFPVATHAHQPKVCVLQSPQCYYNITYIVVWTLHLVGFSRGSLEEISLKRDLAHHGMREKRDHLTPPVCHHLIYILKTLNTDPTWGILFRGVPFGIPLQSLLGVSAFLMNFCLNYLCLSADFFPLRRQELKRPRKTMSKASLTEKYQIHMR